MWCVIKLEVQCFWKGRNEGCVVQGCSMSPIFFLSVFVDDLLREVEKADFGIQPRGGKKVGGTQFADDFVGVSGSKEGLQKL